MQGSLSEEDIDYIREGYRRFADGDPTFLDRFTSDATLVFPETLPKGGTYASPWEALEYFNNVGERFDNPRPEPEEFIRDGDRLVVLGQFHGRSRATGDQVAIRFAHVYRLTGVEGPLSEQRYAAMELFAPDARFVVPTSGRHATVGFAHVFSYSGVGLLAGRKAASMEPICDTVSFAAALAESEAG